MNTNTSSFSTGQGPGTGASTSQNPSNPGISHGGGQRANSTTSAAKARTQQSYNLGREILGRIQTLPREQQLEKLKELQESILKERRKRFENIKAQVKKLQEIEAGFNRHLQSLYRNPGNQVGDDSVLKYLQTAWLKVKHQFADCQRQFINERTRLEIHSTEKTSDFEIRALKLFGFSSENGEGNQGNSSNNLPAGPMAQMAPTTQSANPFGPNAISQQMGQMAPSVGSVNPFGGNGGSQQTGQIGLSAHPLNPFGPNAITQQMGQMAQPVSSVNPFGANGGSQQTGQMGPPVSPMDPYASFAGLQQMGQMAPSINSANPLATNAFLQQMNQLASSNTFANPFGPNFATQQMGQIQPQMNSVNFFGSTAFPQQFGQTAPQGNAASHFLTMGDTKQMEQMTRGVNLTSNFAQQPGYPSGNTVFPGNNNTPLPANLQLPTLGSEATADWFPTQGLMSNPNNPALMNPFGAGQNLAQQAPNLGPQTSQPLTFPSMSALLEMEDDSLNPEGNLNGRAANPRESEIFVFRDEATSGQANDENRQMGPMMTEGGMEEAEAEGEESSVKDSGNENEDRHENENQGADQDVDQDADPENGDTIVAEEGQRN